MFALQIFWFPYACTLVHAPHANVTVRDCVLTNPEAHEDWAHWYSAALVLFGGVQEAAGRHDMVDDAVHAVVVFVPKILIC